MALDVFEELGIKPATAAPPAGRDLFAEFGIDTEPGILDKIKAGARAAGDFVTGAVKQTGQDVAEFVGARPSVMKDYAGGRDLLQEFGASPDEIARGAPPLGNAARLGALSRDAAIAQRAVDSIVAEQRRRDIGSLRPDDSVIDAPFRKPLASVTPEGLLPRVAKDVAAGVTGLGAGFAGAGEWLTGSSNAAAAAKYLEAVTQNLMPEDPSFGDELAAGAGSFAAFFLPGLGVAKGAQAIGKVNAVAANWLGAGSSAALEASAEAGSVYRDLRRQGRNVEQASRAATAVFWSNAALVGVTNKVGLFSEAGGAVRRGATAATTEAFQEGSQQAISNVATGRPVSEGVGTAAGIGAILGGGAGAVMGARSKPAQVDADLPARRAAIADADDAVVVTEPTTSSVAAEPPIAQPAGIQPQPEPVPLADTPVRVDAEPVTTAAEIPGEASAPAGTATDRQATSTMAPVDVFQELGIEPGEAQTRTVDAAAQEAATSPTNALPEPTEVQKESGNYKVGRIKIGGLDISIENPIGSERSGTGPGGTPWSVTMKAHYGYIRRTEGNDGEHVDVYVAKGTPADWAGPAYVVDQVNPATGRFDEHKVVMGAATPEDATRIYDAHFSDASGPKRRAAITQMQMPRFKQWVKHGNLKAPAGGKIQPSAASNWPSDVPQALFRGTGRADAKSVYGGAAVPIMGDGRYFAFSRKDAERYGPKIEQASAPLRNPLVVRSDAEWRALTKEAGWEFPNPFGKPEPEMRKAVDALQRTVRAKDHDGVIVWWDNSTPYDVDARGNSIKALRNVFGEPQAVVFQQREDSGAASRAALGSPAIGPEKKAFRDWFGDSKAVDAQGRPLVVYHGTNKDFTAFDPDAEPISYESDRGKFFFADSKEAASAYAEDTGGGEATGANVMPVYLSLRNPLIHDGSGNASAIWDAEGVYIEGAAKTGNRDSIIVRGDDGSTLYVAFRPEQIKSAIGNRGTFDPANPDIMAATAVPRRTYAPGATATEQVDTDQARPDQIREAMRKLFNVPINERGITIRRAAGIYKVKPQTIRVRNQNDIDVIAHEVGHHFSETKPRVRGLMKTHEGELLAITPDAYAKEPKALRREEGFAEFVRFYLTQPSEARRLAPRFLKEFDAFINDNPHYRAAFDQVRGMVDEWFKLDPVERIMAKVGGRPKSLTERLRENFGKDRLIFEALDNWHPLKLMVADLKPDVAASADPFKAAHLLSGDAAIIEDWLVSGTVPFDPTKRANPANYGKPLHDILKPVAKELRPFSACLIAKRAQELKAHGKENLFTDEEIHAGLALETPAFKAAADEVYAYNDRLLDYAVEGGLLSQEAADRFREYTAYIPFFRESEDGAGGRGKGDVFKRLRGGTDNLRDPIANIIQNTASIVHATNRSAVLAKAYQLAQSVPGGGRWIEAIPMPRKAVQVTTERIIEQLKKEGVAIDTTMAEDLAVMQTFFQPNTLGDDRHRITVVKIDGEPKAIQINNKMLWRALQAFEPLDMGLVGSMLAVPSDLLRAGIVITPDFISRNFMRDTLSGFIQSKRRLVPLLSTVGGFKEVATRSDAYKLYRAFGGAYGDLWKGESEQTRKILERMAKRGKFDPRTILTPSGIIDVLHRLGSVSEAGTRVAEFKKTARLGEKETAMRRRAKLFDVDSLIDAAYNAREVSVDFGMHGHARAVRMLTRITPFLNPAMQGFYKMARTGRERFFTTLLRGSMLAAFSIALFLMNRDEEWYDEIEDWEKNVYWHIDVGLRTDDGKVIPLRIPKPFEWGAVFGSVPEALTQVATDLQGSRFTKRLTSILQDVFAIRAMPTAVLVPAELWANKNTFTDRPIVPESKEGLDPELQFTPGSSLTAREIGEATGTSAAQIDHLVRGFFGTMGVYGVMLADQGLRIAGDYQEPPAPSWRQMPVIKAFVRDPNNPNSRHVNEFYELLNKARRAEASHKKYQGDAANAYYEKHREVMDITRDANQAARNMSQLRKDSEDITSDRDYTGEEKRRRINENNAMIKEIAKGIMRDAR